MGSLSDVNENGLPHSGRKNAHTTQVSHSFTEPGPVDGNLYATVTKRKQEEHVQRTTTTLQQNGSAYHHLGHSYSPGSDPYSHGMNQHNGSYTHGMNQHNGSYTPSLDSGISASSLPGIRLVCTILSFTNI